MGRHGSGKFGFLNVPVDVYGVLVHKTGSIDVTVTDIEAIGDQTSDVGAIVLKK